MGKKSKRKKGEATLGIRARNGIGSQPQQRQSRPNDDDDDDCAAAMAMEEEVRSMKTSDIKSELESRGISTRAVIKRGELIHALVLARKEGMALPPNGMSESTQQPSVSMQQRQRLGNECSHGSGPALGRLTTKGKFFLAAFEENLHEFSHKIVSNDILRAVCESNPTRFWVELMEAGLLNPRYPGNCRPDYRNRDECYNLIALLVSKGTHFLLQAERCDQESHRKTNILLAGFAAHTAQYVEENSRSKSGDLNMLTFSSKGGGLWHIKERETVEFIHSRNGCNCLKVITQTSGRKPRQLLPRQPPSLQQQQGFDLEQTMIDQIDSLTLGRAEILIPDGATCYLCLGDGLDEAGVPLVRDCSCRGDSAGFAHLSCIVQYAKQKCKLAQGTDLSSYLEPWITCLGCKQMYQNQLSHDLTSALLSFTETTYGYPGNCDSDKLRIMIALWENITTAISSTRSTKIVDGDIASKSNENTKMDCEMLIKKLMSMVDEMKKEKHMSGWVYTPPTSLEYKFYELLSGFEARGYKFLAEVSAIDNSTEAGFKTSIAYYERARTIYYQLGMNADAELMDAIIVVYRANLAEFEGGDGKLTASVAYEMAKSFYERSLESSDPTSLKSIEAGLMYGPALVKKGAPFSIEGERLVMKLTADSRRVHGPAHEWTLRADKALKKCRKRFVFVLPDDWKGMLDKTLIQEADMFQALRYDSDLNVCVVTGPITMPTRCQDQEEIRHVAIDLILPCPGCPVICHGLVTALTAYGLENAAHLNGKLGAVKSFRSGALQVVVHFENQSQMPAVVKTENLRIAFDLPSEDPSANDPRVKTFFDVGEKDEPQGKILSRTDSVKYEGDDASVPRDIRLKLEDARKHYAYMIKSFGLTSQETVGPCVEYTQYLLRAHRNIEAERILSKMVTSCRRVNGPEHDITRMAEAALEACKSRFVHVMHRTGSFLALRSENDKCVVTDPIREDDERTFHVAFDLILPFKGCPVKCHGLVSASYLNGEVGEVRGYHENKNGIRLKVRFENKSYHPVMVKPANLRIVFELPKSSRVE